MRNVTSLQEGNITCRFGTKTLGTMAANLLPPHTVAKLTLSNQTFAITGATDASPIVITTANPHGWQTGFLVAILGVNGNIAANSPTGSPGRSQSPGPVHSP